jgi:hypothetical protein
MIYLGHCLGLITTSGHEIRSVRACTYSELITGLCSLADDWVHFDYSMHLFHGLV